MRARNRRLAPRPQALSAHERLRHYSGEKPAKVDLTETHQRAHSRPAKPRQPVHVNRTPAEDQPPQHRAPLEDRRAGLCHGWLSDEPNELIFLGPPQNQNPGRRLFCNQTVRNLGGRTRASSASSLTSMPPWPLKHTSLPLATAPGVTPWSSVTATLVPSLAKGSLHACYSAGVQLTLPEPRFPLRAGILPSSIWEASAQGSHPGHSQPGVQTGWAR